MYEYKMKTYALYNYCQMVGMLLELGVPLFDIPADFAIEKCVRKLFGEGFWTLDVADKDLSLYYFVAAQWFLTEVHGDSYSWETQHESANLS